jgi:hypothetical protein
MIMRIIVITIICILCQTIIQIKNIYLPIMKSYTFSYSFFALRTLSSKFEVIAKGSSIPMLL